MVPGPERTFRPLSASVTVPACWACWQTTAQLTVWPFQLAVTVTVLFPAPGCRLVTMPPEETTAAAGSLLVQVMLAPVTAGRMMAFSVTLPPEARVTWL